MRMSSRVPSVLSISLSIFVIFLVSVALFFPTGYNSDVICKKCGGDGARSCPSCYSGACLACGGDGVNPLGRCIFCSGSGICPTCDGLGYLQCWTCGGDGLDVKWTVNLLGATVYSSLTNIFVFLGLFALGAYFTAFHLSVNEWIHQVRHMNFLFNPSFMTWLFATNRERWAKWSIGYGYISTILTGPIFFLAFIYGKIPAGTLEVSVLISIVILGIFAYFFYIFYITRLRSEKTELDMREHSGD